MTVEHTFSAKRNGIMRSSRWSALACEVEVEFPKTEKKVVLHSKLQSRRWPNVDELARLIRVLGERIDDGEGLADLLARHEEQLALLEQSAPKKPKRKLGCK